MPGKSLWAVFGLITALLCLGVAVGVAGCGRTVERKAEAAVKEILPTYLGPADKYETRVRGSAAAIIRGRLAHVHVDGKNVRLTPDLIADELTLDLTDVEVDTRARQLRAVGSCAFSVALGEAHLNRYIRARRSDIPELRVSLQESGDGGRITVSARPTLLGIPTFPVTVSGRVSPKPPNGVALDFSPERARVSIVPIPSVVLDYLAPRLNPIVDLSMLRVPVQVRHAEVRGRRLLVSGTITPEDLLRASASR